MFDENCMPVAAKDILLDSARVEARAVARRDHLSPGEYRKAATFAERVRAPAPEYQSEVGAGGELIPTSRLCENSRATEFYDTVSAPDYVAVDTSRDRLELANKADALASGLDLADTVEARNSAEKMLCHQMAAVHRSAMTMLAHVNKRLEYMESGLLMQRDMDRLQSLNVEICRLAGTITRMMNTYQQGMTTLQKMRTGGTQRVIIERMQQVNVGDGGQAVVANEIKAKPKAGSGGRRKRKGGGVQIDG